MPFTYRLLLSSSSPDSAPSSVSEPSGGDPQTLVLGLVPCAVGGTRIWMWAQGQPLYEAAVARTRAAVADGGGALGTVLWFQGESDSIGADDARAYGGKMERLVANLRADLGLPSLLVIQDSQVAGAEEEPQIFMDMKANLNQF